MADRIAECDSCSFSRPAADSFTLYNYPPKGRWVVVDIYRDAKRRGIYPPLFTDPEGDSCVSIYQIRWIKKCCFNFFLWNFRETTRYSITLLFYQPCFRNVKPHLCFLHMIVKLAYFTRSICRSSVYELNESAITEHLCRRIIDHFHKWRRICDFFVFVLLSPFNTEFFFVFFLGCWIMSEIVGLKFRGKVKTVVQCMTVNVNGNVTGETIWRTFWCTDLFCIHKRLEDSFDFTVYGFLFLARRF